MERWSHNRKAGRKPRFFSCRKSAYLYKKVLHFSGKCCIIPLPTGNKIERIKTMNKTLRLNTKNRLESLQYALLRAFEAYIKGATGAVCFNGRLFDYTPGATGGLVTREEIQFFLDHAEVDTCAPIAYAREYMASCKDDIFRKVLASA